MTPPTRYRDAGVDIDAGEEAVRRIQKAVHSTFGPHVATEIGRFAGAMVIPGGDPDLLLVASMDGVGTKLKVAALMNRYDTVGQDLVNHCVGDIGVHGAEPLFFLDYVAMGHLVPAVVEHIVEGLAIACRANGCALLGGETAEMPGIYSGTDFDLAGCIVGTVRRDAFVDGRTIRPGDVLLGFPSTGLHTNGYSLARRVLFENGRAKPEDPLPGTQSTLGDALLAVHRSYLPQLRALKSILKGAAHITGGGLPGNVNRMLPEGTNAKIHVDRWKVPPIMHVIGERGEVPQDDLYRAFNMGIGLVTAVDKDAVERAKAATQGEAIVIGEIVAGAGKVELVGNPVW
ncbi:MAG TPA: phosphoribosylformylglycinamidine cyclo-ligase [Candidatus Eisenbacteria bacterium]|nr:phosphoribosylformylglycinamidine cyclo-ligase [Candidatus Eisenbacteria bacterium]